MPGRYLEKAMMVVDLSKRFHGGDTAFSWILIAWETDS